MIRLGLRIGLTPKHTADVTCFMMAFEAGRQRVTPAGRQRVASLAVIG
jgi:hypothetical protein